MTGWLAGGVRVNAGATAALIEGGGTTIRGGVGTRYEYSSTLRCDRGLSADDAMVGGCDSSGDGNGQSGVLVSRRQDYDSVLVSPGNVLKEEREQSIVC